MNNGILGMPKGSTSNSKSLLQFKSVLSSSLWTPTFTTTSLWLDASDSSTITTVSGNVSQWNDKSGNSKHATQSNASNRPLYSVSGFNGNNIVLFNGANRFLTGATSITSGTYTGQFNVFWVCTITGGGTIFTERNSALVACTQWATVSGNYFISSDGANASSNHRISLATYNSIGSNGGLVYHQHVPGFRDLLFLNGIVQTVSTGTANSISGSTGYSVGKREGSVGQHLNGGICELIIITSAVSTAMRQRIEGYLAHKWGLAYTLSVNHPYKNLPPTL